MEQMQGAPQSIPHIVQVYQPSVSNEKLQNPQIIHISHSSLQPSQGKVTYQQTITSESMHIPVSSHHVAHELQNQQIISQNQIVMSCQQTHLQNMHSLQPSQVIQSSDMGQPLHITSHVILPQVSMYKQHVLVNGVQQPYHHTQYNTYLKEHCILTKVEPELPVINEKQIECKSETIIHSEIEILTTKSRSRSKVPNPDTWACNIRKVKHQRGEAYISRRGKYVPEKHVRNTKNCLTSCKFKCSERINDTDREHIFKAFYSLNANEKKHFLLNTTERNFVKHNKIMDASYKRKYSFKYFFLVRGVRYTVCKNFYLGTLAISQKPVYNVHLGKSDMNIPKRDGRGLSEASTHSLPQEVKDRVRKHIMSFSTTESKPVKHYSKKKQYLDPCLSIKQMYSMYFNDCSKENAMPVKESMYRKIFRQEFNLHFKKNKSDQHVCCMCKQPLKKNTAQVPTK